MYYIFQGDFSLLFHAVVINNQEAFQMLLEEGADPEWKNRSGNTVLNLIAKRNLTSWADMCINLPKNMTEERKKFFANQSSHIG